MGWDWIEMGWDWIEMGWDWIEMGLKWDWTWDMTVMSGVVWGGVELKEIE